MEELLQEIRALPGVVGTFVFVNDLGIMSSNLPKVFRGKSLLQIGKAVDRAFTMNDKTKQDVSGMKFKLDESLICVRRIDQGAYLVSVCESGVNSSLMSMTAGVLLAELKPVIEEARKSAPKGSAPAAAKEQSSASTADVDTIINAGPLAGTMARLQEALTRVMGPVGQLILHDAVEKWAAAGEVSEAKIPELLNLLGAEINDPDLESKFRAEFG